MKSAPELLPCPFCGGEAKWRLGGPASYIVCTNCPAETNDGFEDRIAAAWNTRADIAALPAAPDVAGLVEAARQVSFALHHGAGLQGWWDLRDKLDAALAKMEPSNGA